MSDIFTCFAIGSESHLIRCVDLLLERGHGVAGIHTTNPAIAEWARSQRIPLANTVDDIPAVAGEHVDYLFSITNLTILPPAILEIPSRGSINFHDGPLPRFAGLNTPAWAIIEGATRYGITWHWMEERPDRGAILKTESFDIAPDETALTLNTKCYEAALSSFEEVVQDLEAGQPRTDPQSAGEFRIFMKSQRPAAACTLPLDRPADEILRLHRGLNFGAYPNPLGLPKFWVGSDPYVARRATARPDLDPAAPGTIMTIDRDAVVVGTGTIPVELATITTVEGVAVPVGDLHLEIGHVLTSPDAADADRITELNAAVARHEDYWVGSLAVLECPALPDVAAETAPDDHSGRAFTVPPEILSGLADLDRQLDPGDIVAAAFAAYAARITSNAPFDGGYTSDTLLELVQPDRRLFATTVPLRFDYDADDSLVAHARRLAVSRSDCDRHLTYARDVIARTPRLADLGSAAPDLYQVGIAWHIPVERAIENCHARITLVVNSTGGFDWAYDDTNVDADEVARLGARFTQFLSGIASQPEAAVGDIPLLTPAERDRILVEWNATDRPFPDERVHDGFERHARDEPDRIALHCGDRQISYGALNARANQLARHLQTRGVTNDVLVGIRIERSLEMIVSVLAVLKAGGAYVPLDPTYPADRVAFVVRDSGLALILGDGHGEPIPDTECLVVTGGDGPWTGADGENLESGASPADLAYVIYTSGSTGTPKGVMVEHRNVVNFFSAMDDRVPHEGPGVWLAVTSLSFDIAVLELFWTLSRGFQVVLRPDEDHAITETPATLPGGMDFSLFYFASDEERSESGRAKYRLLMEGAAFADQHDFTAVWTPERHFHAFGGLYPNPSVAGAAIAASTTRVRIRAGSCVLPLHHPVRVVEEWSLVDNLSDGRVGIAFASGWQPNDFVLQPENHAKRKSVMAQNIEVVRKLWRGEAVAFPGPAGNDVPVRTLPRPVQPELPVWITTAGNVDTFVAAARDGANVLTHLLGQTVEQIAEKIAAYRDAWQSADHPGRGTVTLMLHAFVGEDEDAVREIVREPMKGYLRSAMSLVRDAAWDFPTFRKMQVDSVATLDRVVDELPVEELDALLDFAFERYYETSGLFGKPERCLELVQHLKSIGVDEIACLIDFGVPVDDVLAHLEDLNRVRQRANPAEAPDRPGPHATESVGASIRRHGVTHVQCTPALARMMIADPETRPALAELRALLVGGEALPAGLAANLTDAVGGDVVNMYGPTETTIWSSTWPVDGSEPTVAIGRPVANTAMYVLDARLQPLPPGAFGELFIGGNGVSRGYLDRADLTAERFLPDPFRPDSPHLLYRTGDVVRWRPSGNLEFAGRSDHQVKIRGYRIELGEIEATLRAHDQVRDAVVTLREDVPGDARLVAYCVPSQRRLDKPSIRAHLERRLPDFMVPPFLVPLDSFPLTPNGKLDRAALPTPAGTRDRSRAAFVGPETETEREIAAIWCEVLDLPEVSTLDDFFDLGGHSLLVIQVLNRLRTFVMQGVALADLFRHTTVRSLAAHVAAST